MHYYDLLITPQSRPVQEKQEVNWLLDTRFFIVKSYNEANIQECMKNVSHLSPTWFSSTITHLNPIVPINQPTAQCA